MGKFNFLLQRIFDNCRIEDPFLLFDELYDKPWTRIGPYLIGMFAGWYIFKTKCQLHVSKVSELVQSRKSRTTIIILEEFYFHKQYFTVFSFNLLVFIDIHPTVTGVWPTRVSFGSSWVSFICVHWSLSLGSSSCLDRYCLLCWLWR